MKLINRQCGFSLIDVLGAIVVMGILAATAIPMTASAVRGERLKGDANAVVNSLALAKMRAASHSSRARLFVDTSTNSFVIQTWDRTANAWTTEDGVTYTSSGVTVGFGTLDTPPPNTQVAIAMSPQCRDDEGNDIGNTSCVVFNSRGIPIDAIGAPAGGNAIYITDGTGVYAATVTATPLVRKWWSPARTAVWVVQ